MARIRTVKPEFFLHDRLFDAERQTGLPLRLSFIGLWCQADREGRFKWQPRRLKPLILPHDEVDFADILDALHGSEFVVRYSANGEDFGAIPSWHKHQSINQREADSQIPSPADAGICTHIPARVEGKGRERNGRGKEGDCTEQPSTAASVPTSVPEPVMEFPTSGKAKTWNLTEDKVSEYGKDFPGIDLMAELRKAHNWAVNNPRKRKTAHGMPAFLSRWLSKAQDAGGRYSTNADDPRGNMAAREQYLDLDNDE